MVIATKNVTGGQLARVQVGPTNILEIKSSLNTLARLMNIEPSEKNPAIAPANIKKSVLAPKAVPATIVAIPIPVAIPINPSMNVSEDQLLIFVTKVHIEPPPVVVIGAA